MKKTFILFAIAAMMFAANCDKYDDSTLTGRMDNLEDRVATLETLCNQMNTNISALQTLVDAMQGGDYITSVTPVSQNGVEVGYTITFAKSNSITIYHGKNGKDGANGQDGTNGTNGKDGNDGVTPVISVAQYNGEYYWTINGQWLTDSDGNKIKASATDGKDGQNGQDGTNGSDGQDGVTPKLKIENDYWYVSYDNGLSWQQLGKATGKNGQDGSDGDSMFKDVREDENNVYFDLAGGTTITIPKGGNESQFAITFDNTDISVLGAGETTTVNYTITAATENTVVKAVAQNGWTATVVPTSVSAGSITITAPNPLVSGEILVFANDGSYRTVMAVLDCSQGTIIVADNSFDITADGGTQQVKLQTNIDYTVNIPNDAQEWISVAETRAMRDETLTFTIQPNSAITQRFATVTLNSNNGAILQSIIFRQSGGTAEGMVEIHEETAGTLQQLLASYDKATIKAMKVTGVMNDKDFLQIYHEMPALRDLDISEVNITSLPNRSFYQSKNVENLILPKTLTTIPDNTFYQSTVKNITFYDKLTSIGASAFAGCNGLANISIPASVETIGASAFSSCTALSVVSFADKCALTALNNHTFFSCLLESIHIPAKVATMSSTTFDGCKALQSVTFEPNSELTKIENSTFESFPALQSIEIPANVETIGGSAFKDCKMLSNVTFEAGSKLRTIGSWESGSTTYGAFENCTSLAKIDIPSNVTTIAAGAFRGCWALTSIAIPASVETIEALAFCGSNLKTITFSKDSKLKSIGGDAYNGDKFYRYGAFYACPLTSITLPASVESIGSTAFMNCTKLITVIFEKNSKLVAIEGEYSNGNGAIGQGHDWGTFNGCTALTAIEIPANVETIGIAAFKGCSNLATVTFESGSKLKTIEGTLYHTYPIITGYGAFSDCSSLSSIEIPANVQTIGSCAFSNCAKLEEINFQEGSLLNTIKQYAFYNCAIMHYFYATNCTLLSSIGNYAFANNDQIWYFEIGAPTPPSCGKDPFGKVGTYSVLKVPAGTTAAYKAATGWSQFSSISAID